jgi:hypothetical protein
MIGAPDTPGNEQFIYDWEKAEGGGGKYNPLNQGPVPGHPEWTTTGEQYGGGAADYASWDAGLHGAAAYLNMSNYTGILNALKNNNPSAARSALFASPWAASHYGYGSDWPNTPLPGGTPVLPPASGDASGGNSDGSGPNYTFNKDTCAWGASFPSAGLFGLKVGGGGFCIISKTEARAILGALLITGGSAVMLFGSAALIAYAFKATGALDAVADVAAIVPGVGGVAGKAVKAAKKTPAKKPGESEKSGKEGEKATYESFKGGTAPPTKKKAVKK